MNMHKAFSANSRALSPAPLHRPSLVGHPAPRCRASADSVCSPPVTPWLNVTLLSSELESHAPVKMKHLALPRRQILQRGDLGGVLLPALGGTAPAPLSILRWCLLALAGAGLLGLPDGHKAVPFDRLHRHAAAGGGAADGGAQAAGTLPLHQRHPHRLPGGDLGEERGHGRVGLACFLLPQLRELRLRQRTKCAYLDGHNRLLVVILSRDCTPIL